MENDTYDNSLLTTTYKHASTDSSASRLRALCERTRQFGGIMRRLNLILLATLQLSGAGSAAGFSIHDDLLAFPQVTRSPPTSSHIATAMQE
jgi:hypothetical protein